MEIRSTKILLRTIFGRHKRSPVSCIIICYVVVTPVSFDLRSIVSGFIYRLATFFAGIFTFKYPIVQAVTIPRLLELDSYIKKHDFYLVISMA